MLADYPFDVSLITISTNQARILEPCLQAIYSCPTGVRFEVMVVDNVSSDGTAEMVQSRFPQAVLLRNQQRTGFAANNNVGLRCAQGRYPLIMNPDVELLPGALDELVDFMDKETQVGIAAAKLYNSDMSLQPSCRRFTTPAHFLIRGLRLDGLLGNTATVRDAVYAEWDHADARDVDYVIGACMMVRREAIVAVGLMDDGYQLYFEDQDWCYRMWQAGWRVAYVPEAQMIHHHQRDSARSLFSRSTRIHVQSMIRYFRKHHVPVPFRLSVQECFLEQTGKEA